MNFEILDIIVRVLLVLAIILCIVLSTVQGKKIKYVKDRVLMNTLTNHYGHNVKIVYHEKNGRIKTVCLKCRDCNETIIDSKVYTLQERSDYIED